VGRAAGIIEIQGASVGHEKKPIALGIRLVKAIGTLPSSDRKASAGIPPPPRPPPPPPPPNWLEIIFSIWRVITFNLQLWEKRSPTAGRAPTPN